jgi:hypothetical protein
MVWRGSPKGKDKLFACLVYLVPLMEVLPFGFYLFILFRPLYLLFLPLFPLLEIYYWGIGGIPIVAFAIFILLYAKVVNNPRLIHFLRYNAMQALLLAVFAWLCSLCLQLFGITQELLLSMMASGSADLGSLSGLATIAILTVIFCFVTGSSFYAIFQCIRGLYAEIPIISDNAYAQVRY